MTPAPRLRVAHITTVDASLRYLLLHQMQSLQAAGFDVVGISAPGEYVRELAAGGVPHLASPMSRNFTPFADLLALFRLTALLRRERFTIVHTHTPKAGLLGQLAARFAGVPVIVNTVHGFYFHDHMAPRARWFYLTVEKVAALCSHAILSQNAEDLQTAIRERICPAARISHLGNGIDLTNYDPARIAPETVTALRESLALPAGTPVVAFVGRLAGRRKGFLDFLAAARELAAALPAIRFLIVGSADAGKPDAVEPSAAADYGIADRCIFTGHVPTEQLPPYYRLMSLLVLPSLFEGVPRVVMEASAMGVPCVVSDVKGNREAVESGRNGLLVPLGDVPALTAAIRHILDHPDVAARFAEGGRAIAAQRFDERLVFQRVRECYETQLRLKRLIPPPVTPLRPQPGKRAVDFTAAAILLLLLWPVMLLSAIAVALRLGRPVLFRQQRPGRGGHPFHLWKLRTMNDERDATGELKPDADRLTPFGVFLRRTSLDELPQLLNVLRGDMSLVGPRPLLMSYLPNYSPEQQRRHAVHPGITGWAQVHGRNTATLGERLNFDVWYVENWSLWLDLQILGKTVLSVLGAHGVKQGQPIEEIDDIGLHPETRRRAAAAAAAEVKP